MAYTITKTNGATIATIVDGTVDSTSTSLTLIGKNYAGYGVFLNDNFVKLLENFANGTAPTTPLNGQLWFDSSNRILKIYDASVTSWKSISSSTTSATQPTTSITGDLWWDISNNQLKAYNGSSWVLVGPTYTTSSGQSGALVETIIDNSAISHVVIKFYIQNTPMAIVSKVSTFTPQTAIPGYTTISPGVNLISSGYIAGAAFNGDVSNALAVGGVEAANLLKKYTDNDAFGLFKIKDSRGLRVGGSDNFSIVINDLTSAVNLTNTQTSADVNFYVTPSGLGATKSLSIVGSSGQVLIPNSISSTSTTTGALVVTAGVGIGGALNVGGTVQCLGATQSNSATSGALIVTGGVGVGSNVTVGGALNVLGSSGISGNVTVTSGVSSTSTTSGALTVTGGVGVTGNINAGNVNATYIYGNIIGTVSSVVTSVGTLANLAVTGVVEFGNLVYANAGIASTTTTNGTLILSGSGGIGLGGNLNAGGNVTAIGNVNAASSRITNNITAGGLYIGNIQSTANNISNIGSASSGFNYLYAGNIMPMAHQVGNIGSPSAYYNRVHATSTSALYSDLAERYAADANYEAGTVMDLGGEFEITISTTELSNNVFGVISTQPAYIMNEFAGPNETHPVIALQGRVPVKVIGKVSKGDRLVSAGNGQARAAKLNEITPFNVIGRSLVDKTTDGEDLILAVVRAIS